MRALVHDEYAVLRMRFFPRVWLIILSLLMAPIHFAGSPTGPQDQPIISPSPVADADVASINLIIPVEGVRANELRDTFDAPRSGGRLHRAIDIMARRGTPVLAAADGEIIRISHNRAGGNTIYQMSEDKKLVFYYAHLDEYADDLATGDFARQGEVIGYVGDTGNAGSGNFHLHFSIWTVTDPKKYWQGDNINPYPLLKH